MRFLSTGRTVAGLLLAAGVGTGLACSKSDPKPAGTPAGGSQAPTSPGEPENPLALDPADLGTPGGLEVARQNLRDLAFHEVSAGLPKSGTWKGYPLLFDFTGDGRADLVSSNREEDGFSAWTIGAKGEWELRNEGLPRGMSYGPCAAADFDGDKIPDLAIIDHQTSVRLFKNDGKMTWTELPAPSGRKPLAMDIAAGDIDGDGRADLVGIGHFNGGIQVYLNQGDGRLESYPGAASMLGDKGFGRDVELEDLDLDGTLDIVAATEKGVKAYLTRTKPSLSFEDASEGLPKPTFGGNTIYAVAVERFLTSSKRPQVAVALVPDPMLALESRSSLGVYAWDEANRSWSTVDQGLVRTESCLDLDAADFDQDGSLDLLVASFQSGIVLYRGDGAGRFEPAGRLPCKSLEGSPWATSTGMGARTSPLPARPLVPKSSREASGSSRTALRPGSSRNSSRRCPQVPLELRSEVGERPIPQLPDDFLMPRAARRIRSACT